MIGGIVKGGIGKGDFVPSVRELVLDYGVVDGVVTVAEICDNE